MNMDDNVTCNIENYTKEIQLNHTSSDEYEESSDKTSQYTEEDWEVIRARAYEIHKKLADNMDKGAADPEVQKIVAELRQHITDDVCDCTPEILRCLGDIYVRDERLTAKVDKYRTGLSFFLWKVIHNYCDNLEKQSAQ